jgi:flagellar biosynthesis protein FliR
MWNLMFDRYIIFLLVFIRIMAAILFNPLLGRKNIPVVLKMGLSFILAVVITSTLSNVNVTITGIPDFVFASIKEVLIGLTISFILQMFLSVVILAGELIDLQMGVGMAKIYDPLSNVSMPITGSIFNLFFMLIFFAGNGHLTLIRIISLTFQMLPPGPTVINFMATSYIFQLFANILILALKLALPIVAIELVSEIGIGVLMRSVPQINVFVVGLQLKMLIGLVVIIFILPSVGNMFDSTINTMFDNIGQAIKLAT